MRSRFVLVGCSLAAVLAGLSLYLFLLLSNIEVASTARERNRSIARAQLGNEQRTTLAVAPSEKVHSAFEGVSVGRTTCAVGLSWWSDKLTEGALSTARSDASFLFIQIGIHNGSSKPCRRVPFHLVDDRGALHSEDRSAWCFEGTIGEPSDVNPGVTLSGVLVFNVPRSRSYRLRVDEDSWFSRPALIEITPGRKP